MYFFNLTNENEFTIAVLITCHNRQDKTISFLDAIFEV